MSPAAKKPADKPEGDAIAGFEAEGWRPETGDWVRGTMRELSAGWSDYAQSEYPIITLDVIEAGNIKPDATEADQLAAQENVGKPCSVHAFQATLRRMLIETQPRVGETIKITCGGKRKTGDGKRSVMLYKLEVEGREGESAGNWERFGASSRPGKAAQVNEGGGVEEGADHPFD